MRASSPENHGRTVSITLPTPTGQKLALKPCKTRSRRLMLWRSLLRMNSGFAYSLVLQLAKFIYPVYVRGGKPTLRPHRGQRSSSRVSENPRPSRDCAQPETYRRRPGPSSTRVVAVRDCRVTLPRARAQRIRIFLTLLGKRADPGTFPHLYLRQAKAAEFRKTAVENPCAFGVFVVDGPRAGEFGASRGRARQGCARNSPFKGPSTVLLQRGPAEVFDA